MPIKDRVLNERNFAETLNKARALRQELIAAYINAVKADTSTPTKQAHVEWREVGTIERQCSLLQELLNEFTSD